MNVKALDRSSRAVGVGRACGRILGLLAVPVLALVTASVLFVSGPNAQKYTQFGSPWGQSDATPSFQFAKGVPISPNMSANQLGSATTSTDLCGIFASQQMLCPGGVRPRAPELVELARALQNDPDLIYEYVRNSINTDFTYGVHKGAVGTMIDRSGGAFDQAQLLVELLRQAGYTARYRFGDITLTGAQFLDWSGVQNAQAACELLSGGGIPATVNGNSTNCATLSGNVTTVVMSHAWAEAVIGATTYQFDPSYKPYSNAAARVDVRSAMGLIPGAAFYAGTQGLVTNPDGSIQNLSTAGVRNLMQGYGDTLLTRFNQADLADANVTDVLGGREILPAVRPVNGWKQVSLAYVTNARATWSGNVPNQYRTKVTISGSFPGVTGYSAVLYSDELAGRKAELYLGHLIFDNVDLGGLTIPPGTPGGASQTLTMAVDHPFAATSKTYGDASYARPLGDPRFYSDVHPLVFSWGTTSMSLASKLSREQSGDRYVLFNAQGQKIATEPTLASPGDTSRQRLAATWLGQFAQLIRINDPLAASRTTHLHTIGLAVNEGEQNSLDLQTSVTFVSLDRDMTKRRGGAHALAALSATLEGSVAEQLNDSPASASTARRFDFANTAGIKFRAFNPALATAGDFADTTSCGNYYDREGVMASAVNAYRDRGFKITAPLNVGLGPGLDKPPAWFGTCDIIPVQLGGAMVATLYDANGDPTEIAHVAVGFNTRVKGGGGPAPEYKPEDAADALKDKFVDRSSAMGVDLSSGTAGFTSPVLRSVGQGEFPYLLAESIALRGSGLSGVTSAYPDWYATYSRNLMRISEGPVSSFDGGAQVSSSGMEGMGATRIQAAAHAIAAVAVVQDIYREAQSPQRDVIGLLAADWFGRQLIENVVSIAQGAGTEQFVRAGMEGSARLYIAGSGPGRVTVSGSRQAVQLYSTVDNGDQTTSDIPDPSETFLDSGLTITNHDGSGNKRTYGYWSNVIAPDIWHQVTRRPEHTPVFQGFRLNQWDFVRGVTLTMQYGTQSPGVPISVSSNAGPSLTLSTVPGTFLRDSAAGGGVDVGCLSWANQYAVGTQAQPQFTNAAGGIFKLVLTGAETQTATRRPVDSCRLQLVYEPDDLTTPKVRYTYDDLGRIKQAEDAVAIRTPTARDPHEFFIAEGYRGSRLDPEGGRYANETLQSGRQTRHIDELGRVVTSILDGRGRAVDRISPEGNRVAFIYDQHDNPITMTRFAKPSSLEATAYPAGIAIQAAWHGFYNKPMWVREFVGTSQERQTDFEYHGGPVLGFLGGNGEGELKTATRPSPGVSGTRPIYGFEYDNRGRPIRTTVPGDGAAEIVETVSTYDANGFMSSSRTGTNGMGLYRYFRADAIGNVTEMWDARGEAATKTTTTFDAMRRPTRAAKPENTVTEWDYDPIGRIIEERRRLLVGMSDTWQTWQTGYTPTGKEAWKEDPAGDTATAEYDGLDRTIRTVDPQGNITRVTYDLAGQVLEEKRAVGAVQVDPTDPVEQSYFRYGYGPNGQRLWLKDARNNQTDFDYDGFDRPLLTTFPDGTREGPERLSSPTYVSPYDLASNVLRFRVRRPDTLPGGGAASLMITEFDRLDRKTRVRGLWSDGTDATTHEWWRWREATYTYDLAGRMLTAVNDQVSLSWTFDDAGRAQTHNSTAGASFSYVYDVASNLTSLVYPDSKTATYTYDNLNRMRTAGFTGGALATLNYDTLSRRTSVAFGDGSSQTYAWETDNDLLTLAHVFPNATSGNVTYGYTTDRIGRQTNVTISNPTYAYSPPLTTNTYAAATGANTYPTFNSFPLSWSADGTLADDGANWKFFYDQSGNLRDIQRRTQTADREYYYTDALGVRWYSRHEIPGGTDPSSRYFANGQRPETVYERTYTLAEGAGSSVFAGARFSVLGPNPDERLIWVDTDGLARYPHTDRIGSTIAMSRLGVAESKWHYGPYGEATQGPSGYPYRFTGQHLNAFTGLYHYKSREYSPELGRFIQNDPIRFSDGPNMYSYVGNDPLNRNDPTGLQSDVSLFGGAHGGSDPNVVSLVQRDIDSSQYFIITAHAGRNSIASNHSPEYPELTAVDMRQLQQLMTMNHFTRGQDVFITTCFFGEGGENSSAAQLSVWSRGTVVAGDGWVQHAGKPDHSGTLYVTANSNSLSERRLFVEYRDGKPTGRVADTATYGRANLWSKVELRFNWRQAALGEPGGSARQPERAREAKDKFDK